jgi:S-adenosylmethionine-diacylgycerolhomoserine-N-methlytransferase
MTKIDKLTSYYRFHAPLYDATRWAFLFGRSKINEWISQKLPDAVIEIGCGTGKNLEQIHYLSKDKKCIDLRGVELSESMINKTGKHLNSISNISITQGTYNQDFFRNPKEALLFSYSFTMMNISAEVFAEILAKDVKPGGFLALVDFLDSPSLFFREWMAINHVDFSPNLLDALQRYFDFELCEINNAYLGMWSYVILGAIRKE